MRFDHTKGQKAKYMVSEHWETGSDHYYFHYYANAKDLYDRLKATALTGTRISLWDMAKDVRKEFTQI